MPQVAFARVFNKQGMGNLTTEAHDGDCVVVLDESAWNRLMEIREAVGVEFEDWICPWG